MAHDEKPKSLKEIWEEGTDKIKLTWAGKGNFIFNGTCPFCKSKNPFYLNTKKGLNARAFVAALNPRNAFRQITSRDSADHGFCSNCDKEVMLCPRCGSINRAEYVDAKCLNCGKEYTHR